MSRRNEKHVRADHTSYRTVLAGLLALLMTFLMSVTGGNPARADRYRTDAEGQWVSLDGGTGQCDPSVVRFDYYRIQDQGEYIDRGDPDDGPADIGGYIPPEPDDGDYGYLPTLPWEGAAAYINAPYVYQDYIKPQCGPGDQYRVFMSMNGSRHLYNPNEITRADIFFTVGDWAYVGFGYSDGKWRYGFFRKDVFTPYDGWGAVPEYFLGYEQYGTVTQTTIPYNGPDRNSGEYESCRLDSGDAVYACMEYNGWYLCRFYNDHSNNYGYVYLWVPGTAICW